MPDLESRLPELLHRAATSVPRDPGLERAVLRRARRRRALTATAGAVAAIALVAGSFVGVRAIVGSEDSRIAVPGPEPAQDPVVTIPAVWPETTAEALAEAQTAIDDGHSPWRLDPVQTAAAFTTNLFLWDANDVRTNLAEAITGGGESRAVVEVWNVGLGPGAGSDVPPAPVTTITLRQLGRTGDEGIWSVVSSDTPLIELAQASSDPGAIPEPSGRLVDVIMEWTLDVWPVVDGMLDLDGASGVTWTAEVEGEDFTTSVSVQEGATAEPVVPLLVLWDPEGTVVAGEAVPTAGSTEPTDVLPAAVAEARDAIVAAAQARDFDALQALIDPDRFAYNFDDGSDPIPLWREDPSVLDTIVTVLSMPYTTNEEAYGEIAEDSPIVYIWPSLMASDLEDLTPDEQAMLDELGISDAAVQDMVEAFGGYVGPRTGITEDGTWVFYTEGGD